MLLGNCRNSALFNLRVLLGFLARRVLQLSSTTGMERAECYILSADSVLVHSYGGCDYLAQYCCLHGLY